jgi:hypothetical protein
MKQTFIAKPNDDYIWKTTFDKCTIQAVLEDETVHFLEYFNGRVNELTEELVRSLFPTGETPLNERPFIEKDNTMFYAILYRREPQYKEQYQLILKRKIVRRTV